MVSLEDLGFGNGEAELSLDHADGDPLRSVLRRERLRLAAQAIGRLPEREQLLLTRDAVGARLGEPGGDHAQRADARRQR